MDFEIDRNEAEGVLIGDVTIALTPKEFTMLHTALTRHLDREHEDMAHARSDLETLVEDCGRFVEAHEVWQWMENVKTTLDAMRSNPAQGAA